MPKIKYNKPRAHCKEFVKCIEHHLEMFCAKVETVLYTIKQLGKNSR